MKHLLTFSLCLLALLPLCAQEKVEYVDDEECGCELVFIDGIQTTQDGHTSAADAGYTCIVKDGCIAFTLPPFSSLILSN